MMAYFLQQLLQKKYMFLMKLVKKNGYQMIIQAQ